MNTDNYMKKAEPVKEFSSEAAGLKRRLGVLLSISDPSIAYPAIDVTRRNKSSASSQSPTHKNVGRFGGSLLARAFKASRTVEDEFGRNFWKFNGAR